MSGPLHLVPPPRRVRRRAGVCRLGPDTTIVDAAGTLLDSCSAGIDALVDEFHQTCGFRPARSVQSAGQGALLIRLRLTPGGPAGAYRLDVASSGIDLDGADEAGCHYALQTLLQLVHQFGRALPRLRIEDEPDFAVRGYYLDVSRGKVPTRETLCGLIARAGHYKLNQVQLYIEHTFAFQNHPDVWAGSDPLTAEDVLALDACAAAHHVELVPSLSSFGHFCTWLKSPRKEHLNELPVRASERPFSWRDRLAHYTLDCSNPDSIRLVEELIAELAPLFRSRHFNICCDETFDLGRGRNAAKAARHGRGRLYIDFVKKIARAVKRQGKIPMLWGDVLLEHPEVIGELQDDAVILHWDYSPDARRGGLDTLARSRHAFHVCAGVHGWRGWLHDLDTASANIRALAEAGRAAGAAGMLTTDWGDCGHVSFLSGSMHGMMLGASAAWNGAGISGARGLEAFDRAYECLETGDGSGAWVESLRALGSAQHVGWKDLANWVDACEELPGGGRDLDTGLPAALLAEDAHVVAEAFMRMREGRHTLAVQAPRFRQSNPAAVAEAFCAAEGAELTLATALVLLRWAGAHDGLPARMRPGARETADAWRRFETRLSALWHRSHRPSEYFRVKLAVLEMATRLDRLDAR